MTRSWTNSAGGNWFVAANWSPNGAPTVIDTANITNGGTYTVTILTGSVAVAVINLGAASGTQTLINGTGNNLNVTNAGTVRANGILSITSGGLQGNVVIQPGGQLELSGAAAKNVYSLTLLNQGTVNWSGGTLYGGSTPTTVISNGGLWEITTDSLFYNYYGSAMTWINSGTLRKSAGSGTATLSGFNFFNQPSGVIDTLAGTLALVSVTDGVLGGSLTATSPGLLSLAGGLWTDAGGAASGTGTNRFAGGTLNLRTNIIAGLRLFGGDVYVTGTSTFQQAGAITNLLLEGSQLRGTNRVGSGTLTVNAGGMDGQFTVLPAGQLALATGTAKNVYSLTLLNQGTVNWSGGTLYGGSTPTTVISNGGLWEITTDSLFYNYYGSAMTWINSGTLRKSAGSGTATLSGFNFFNQPTGLIQADTGILQLPTPITNSAGILRLNGGTIQSSGTYGMTDGTLEGAGSFGDNAITGGIVSPGQSGPGLMGFRSGLNFGAGATLTMSGTGTIPGTQYDQLSVTGAVSLANATLSVTSLPSVAPGTTFVLILNDGADGVSGTFNGLAENSVVNVSGQPFRIHYGGGSGNDVTLVRDSGSASTGPQLSNNIYTNGTFRLFGSGSNAVIYTVQATTNFIQWTNVGFATGDVSGAFTFADTNAFRFQYRFYRTTN